MDSYSLSGILAVGAGLSIYLGYRLFIAGATGSFKFSMGAGPGHVGLESIAPGLAFAAFGMIIAVYALFKMLP